MGELLAAVGIGACAWLAWRFLATTAGRRRGVAAAGAGACLLLSAFCFWLWYDLYLIRDFNELGRDYDPVDQVVYTDSGFVWIVPALLLLAAGAWLAWRARRRDGGRPAWKSVGAVAAAVHAGIQRAVVGVHHDLRGPLRDGGRS